MGAYEWLIGTRYLRSTHRRGFVSFVALMSVCGLTLGVATLSGALPDWRDLQQQVRRQSGVQAAVPYVESQAMLANGLRLAGASVRGVLPEEERVATGQAHHVTSGSLDDLKAGAYGTILGSALAHELNARVGDSVVLIAPAGTATPTGVVPRMRRFRVVGLFQSGMYEFDRGLALVHM